MRELLAVVLVIAGTTCRGTTAAPRAPAAEAVRTPPAATTAPASTCPEGMALISAGSIFSHCLGQQRPAHVTVAAPFCIDRDETTVSDYAGCVREDACSSTKTSGVEAKRHPRHPVADATIEQAIAYCRHRGVRLPTPFEWLRAAGGEDGRGNPWGNSYPEAGGVCWLGRLCDVGTSPTDVSPFGVRDMGASVREWTFSATGCCPGETYQCKGGHEWRSQTMRTVMVSMLDTLAGIRCAADVQGGR
jgi:formylglycine-generating enzyme required for sulfatase activity